MSEGVLPIFQKLRQSQKLSFEDWFEVCVLPVQSSLYQFKPVVIKLEMWPKPKFSTLNSQKQIAPTVLSEPWGCLQYCWSCMRSFNASEFVMTFYGISLHSATWQQPEPNFYSFPMQHLFFSICLCVVCGVVSLWQPQTPQTLPAKTDDGWGLLLKQRKFRVLCFPP